MQNDYEVIIIGGGPTGVALGIELGLNNIQTLILEKHSEPLLSPRAMSLNVRTMELMQRWGVVEKLKSERLLPDEFAQGGVWCSALNGTTYAKVNSDDQIAIEKSAEKALRIPLYITENVLRERLSQFNCVTMLKDHAVTDVHIENNKVIVKAENRDSKTHCDFSADYAVGCDGANSITRESMKIAFNELAPKRSVVNVMFEAPELANNITVEKGFLFYMLHPIPGAMGPVNLKRGLWYAQIINASGETNCGKINIDEILETMVGFSFQKKIVSAYLWDMQIKIAEYFSKNNRVFLVGDSAHAFAPTGGFGLNTGLGDVANLGWKLSAIIHKKASDELLKTFEVERKPVCLRNLEAAEKNALAIIETRKAFPPEKDPVGFAKANAENAKRHALVQGLAMGYAYFDSPLTHLSENQSLEPMPPREYIPTAQPGYFLPYKKINEKTIYELLSPTHWTLIVCGKEKVKIQSPQLKILHVPENTYPSRDILIRPDWHIALISNEFNASHVEAVFKYALKQ
ncbi:MAG: FAD-dependent monooxygenase [Gammaproteobacteria bacterium]|nr:FAD-dependent monooxygenase [Gammaproteobacteria bacterium]